VSPSNVTDEDLLILRYLTGHDRYWGALKLAPLIGLTVVRAAECLAALERQRLVKGLRDHLGTAEPEFCITNDGRTAVIVRRFDQPHVEAPRSNEHRYGAHVALAGSLWPLWRSRILRRASRSV
jgi:hypothetical protein